MTLAIDLEILQEVLLKNLLEEFEFVLPEDELLLTEEEGKGGK